MDLFTPAQAAALLGADYRPGPHAETIIRAWLYDTRLIADTAGAMFIALPGAHRNGETFVAEAYRRGVRMFLTTISHDLPDADVLVVPDPLRALQLLAEHHRKKFDLPVVGVTGSNGKTIVKEWLASLLEPDFDLLKSPRSFNSQLGVALSVLELRAHHNLAIFEAGISQRGEMSALTAMIRPTLGLLTHFGDAHAEGFASDEEKLAEKMRLFADCPAVLTTNIDLNLPDARQVGEALVKADFSDDAWRFTLRDAGREYDFTFPQAGDAALENVLLALAAARRLGAAWEDLQQRVGGLYPVSMRTEVITDNPELTIINDAYNADVASVENALSLLAGRTEFPRKILILSDLEHQGARQVAAQTALLERLPPLDKVLAVGPVFHALAKDFPNVEAYETTDALMRSFDYAAFRQSVVLLKGARRYHLERLTPYLTRRAHATYFKINLNALEHNLRVLRGLSGARVMAMVKAAAYGAGAWQLAQELARLGVDYFAVAYTTEGIELREKGLQAPIMVMNPDEAALAQLARFALEPAVGSLRVLRLLAAGAPLRVHLEFDTGMGRLGFAPESAEEVQARLAEAPHLQVAGVFTHLAAADDPAEDAFTRGQLATFNAIRRRWPDAPAHALNTAGLIRFPEAAGDLVRAGLGLYGLNPAPVVSLPLQEIGSLHTLISQLHHYPAEATVGYNRRGRLDRPTVLATIPVGYADGLPRLAGEGRCGFLVRGRRVPVVGAVCMDLTMLDVTDVPDAAEGDEVVLFGAQGESFQSVQALADAALTIPYEILCRIGPRVRRVYVRE